MSEKTAMSWAMPAVIGVIVGALAAGGPLLHLKQQTTAQLVEVSAQLAAASANAATLAQQLQQLEAERATMQTQLGDQQQMAQELAKPDLPIQLSVRKGFIDAGYVLTIKNVSPQEIAVNAKFSGAGGAEQMRRLVLPANGVREVGESEGWAFSSRDSITLTNADYRDLSYMIPVY